MNKFADLIGVEIQLHSCMPSDEIQLRIEQEEAACLGKIAFINGRITIDDYIDILEMCEVDIDDYFIAVEQNIEGLCPGLMTPLIGI